MTTEDYLRNPNICLACGEPIMPCNGQRLSDILSRKFCRQRCAAIFNNHRRILARAPRFCLCSKQVSRGSITCSRMCHKEHVYRQFIESWKSGNKDGVRGGGMSISRHIRNYLISKRGELCWKCGWCERNPSTGRVPLTVNHIDGNGTNNIEDNLEMLCPNCHSLTPTYGGLNRGNGREIRRKLWQSKHASPVFSGIAQAAERGTRNAEVAISSIAPRSIFSGASDGEA